MSGSRTTTTEDLSQTAVWGIGAAAQRVSRATTEQEIQSAMTTLRLKVRLLEIRALAAIEDARTDSALTGEE